MDLEKYNSIIMDFQNLMSCIKCHEDSDNISIILETLKTIVDISNNEDCGKDAFREEGGLEFLIELISTTDSTVLLEHLLKTLAFVIDENVHNQIHVTKKEYFLVLQAIIQKPTFPPVILRNSLLLTSSILFQNSLAQGLMSEIGLLQDIIKLFEQMASFYICNNFSSAVLSDSPIDILISASSALCFAVNNPQNERNQEACSVLFPLSLKLFESSSDMALSGSLSSFLSLCVANNVHCQQKFADADGLLGIKRLLQKHYDSAALDVTEFHNVVSKCTFQSLSNLVGIITAVVSENDKNAAILGKLGVITLMIKLLITGIIDDELKTRIILALAYCVDTYSSCKSYVLQFDNFHNFLKICLQNGSLELVSASKYLLQVFLNGNDTLSESDFVQHDQLFPSVSDKCSVSKFKADKLFPTKNSIMDGSIRSIISSKECERSFTKRKFPPDSNNQTNERCEGSENFLNRVNGSICGRCEMSVKPTSQVLQSSAHKAFSPFKRDNPECYQHSHTSHAPSVKNYRNCKKENILLIDSDDCSLSRCCNGNSDYKRMAGKQSILLSGSGASSQNVKANCDGKILGAISPRHEINDARNSVHGYCSSSARHKKDKPSLSEMENFDHKNYKHNIRLNKNIKTQKNSLIGKSKENNWKENSVLGSWNEAKCNDDVYSSLSENLWKSGNGSVSAYKTRELSERNYNSEARFSPHSLHNTFTNNFLKPFDFGLANKTNSSKSGHYSQHHKRKKTRRKNNFGSIFHERQVDASSLNLDSDQAFGNDMQIIVLPGDCCEQHKLIASSELLKVKPLKDAVLTMDQC